MCMRSLIRSTISTVYQLFHISLFAFHTSRVLYDQRTMLYSILNTKNHKIQEITRIIFN